MRIDVFLVAYPPLIPSVITFTRSMYCITKATCEVFSVAVLLQYLVLILARCALTPLLSLTLRSFGLKFCCEYPVLMVVPLQ